MGIFDFLKRIFSGDTGPPRSQLSSTANRDFQKPTDPAPTSPPERKPRSLSGLDTDKFAPLSVDDALSETTGSDWTTAFFDSLNTIPPSELPRIRVIDRTMVGLGLISQEELAEIHEIGRQMDEYRNVHIAIERAGHQAIARSRAEKERIKAEKKREAEERKKAHQEAVALRRANDIIFLGRGVSKGLADRRSNVEKLQANGLPVLSTPKELAEALTISISRLRWLAFHGEAPTMIHYFSFFIPKKSGGQRKISSPHAELRKAQNWILANMLRKIPIHESAHGFVARRSTVTNAKPHVGSKILVNADLQDFFPSIELNRVMGLFRSFGYSPAVSTILGLLTTESPRQTVRFGGTEFHPAVGNRCLPQGACTSPYISNLISRNLDRRLTGIARKLSWTYTRYADDLSFSKLASDNHNVGYLLARIRHICEDEGFKINPQKTRVLRPNTRQSVTGIVVNDQPSIPRQTVRRLRAILNNAQHNGLESQNRMNHPNFKQWLQGMVSYVEMVNPTQGRKLREMFDALSN